MHGQGSMRAILALALLAGCSPIDVESSDRNCTEPLDPIASLTATVSGGTVTATVTGVRTACFESLSMDCAIDGGTVKLNLVEQGPCGESYDCHVMTATIDGLEPGTYTLVYESLETTVEVGR